MQSAANTADKSSGGLAIVTGASRGIGKAIAHEFLQQGITVLGVARSFANASEASPAAANFIPCAADVTNADDVKRIIATAQDTKLPLLALVNNAGVLDPIAKLGDVEADKWRHNFEVNVVAVLTLTQQALPMLRATGGRVINVSSGAAVHAYQGWSAYCSSKAALNMLTKSMAVEEPD
ncbi:hypothetical protein IWW38_004154, partial [Coemansia aciculifera]